MPKCHVCQDSRPSLHWVPAPLSTQTLGHYVCVGCDKALSRVLELEALVPKKPKRHIMEAGECVIRLVPPEVRIVLKSLREWIGRSEGATESDITAATLVMIKLSDTIAGREFNARNQEVANTSLKDV